MTCGSRVTPLDRSRSVKAADWLLKVTLRTFGRLPESAWSSSVLGGLFSSSCSLEVGQRGGGRRCN